MAEALLEKRDVSESLARLEAAEDAFSQALELGQLSPDALTARGRVRSRLGHFDRALSDLDEALDLNPEHQEALELRADLFAHLHRENEAQADLERLAAIRAFLEEKRNMDCLEALAGAKYLQKADSACAGANSLT